MTPLARSTNLAARMGRWSARHKKTAIAGWLAFVLLALVVGSLVGTSKLDSSDIAAGKSEHAQAIIDRGEFADGSGETILVQSETLTADDPAFAAAVTDVVNRITPFPAVHDLHTPFDRGAHLVSADGRSALIRFEVEGDDAHGTEAVKPLLAAVEEAQAANPGFVVEQFGEASSMLALDETIAEDFERAELLALPITLGILIV
ncbi:MAG TPA: hypothetical protein VK896_12960, partial [Gaiellaceae bacterium]|nr:hypothetical protein [Gaiellaceae bacterium]